MRSIIPNEKFVEEWYLDTKNKPTIGIGFEITSLISELNVSSEPIKKEFAKFILSGDYL